MSAVANESEAEQARVDGARLLLATRVLAVMVIPVLVAAFVVLFGFPGRTRQLWAWTIRPDLAALIMGGAYIAGAWFFARTLLDGRWHRVALGTGTSSTTATCRSGLG